METPAKIAKFICLEVVHPDDVLQDSHAYFRTEDIRSIWHPTPVDKKRREEIKALLLTNVGCYAVSKTPERIGELIQEAEI